VACGKVKVIHPMRMSSYFPATDSIRFYRCIAATATSSDDTHSYVRHGLRTLANACNDAHMFCPLLQTIGECTNSPIYMKEKCPKSCGLCPDPCADVLDLPVCAALMAANHCVTFQDFMCENCRSTCGLCNDPACGGGPTPTCSDALDQPTCDALKNADQCAKNKNFMCENCRSTCGFCNDATCDVVCADDHEYCSAWAARGECKTNSLYMFEHCKDSCNWCGSTKPPEQPCTDDSVHCDYWEGEGECTKNPWMVLQCRKSCGGCDKATEPLPVCMKPGCEDCHDDCPKWAAEGRCNPPRGFMYTYWYVLD